MDIWEANSVSQAFTPHPCKSPKPVICKGAACGNGDGDRYKAECDKDGCDFASYRWGAKEFFGPSKTVDSTKKFTVITQFITSDGTDTGPLSEIRRIYVQDGKTIKNEAVKIPGLAKPADSITQDFCDATKKATGDVNDFKIKGGMKGMDAALEKGMVLVFSLWDDHMAQMNWLDSNYPPTKPATAFGVARGTCDAKVGDPDNVRAKFGDATVEFSEVKIGPIGSISKSTETSSTTSGGTGTKSTPGKKRKACRSVRY
jgi:cellulose 1,4-beta-cellobiosidase